MKYIKYIIVALFVLVQVNSANAQWVVAAPATDAIAIVKSAKDAVFQAWDQVKKTYDAQIQQYNDGLRYANQITEIQNQYNQITQMATAMKGLDTSSFATLKNSLQSTFNQTNDVFNRLHGMNNTIESIEGKFESTYPTMANMAGLDPEGWNKIFNTSTKEQRDGIYNAQIKAANLKKLNSEMQAKITALSDKNSAISGRDKDSIVATAQLGNQIALQQQQLLLQQNETMTLILKQNADNANNAQMLQQIMQKEAEKSFAYTKIPVTTEGAGIYKIK
jgi:conjugal transfer/entry exclusion protein